MEYSLCKQLQQICLSERLLQLSYNEPGLKLLDSIKKCNIIFRIEEPQITDYVHNLVLDTNETGVGVNYNMYDFGSFEKLLEALKHVTGECENLKLSPLSKKIYSKFMTTLCTYISIITNTDRVIYFLEHIKPFGVFCLDKDMLVNLQPLDRIESTVLVNGKVSIHDNIPLVLPMEKIINLYDIEKYACPLPVFCVVAPMPGIFGENLERYPHHITDVYDFQSTIESTNKILDIFSNKDLRSVMSSVYPKQCVHLPYGIGFYIGTPQMTSYGALMQCNKQILSYQDFPLVSHITYTVGSILLGYIYPEGVTFQYNQIKQDDGSFSLYFNSYTYTCKNEWIWKTFRKKQLLTNTDEGTLLTIESSENKPQINFPDKLYQNITDDIDHNINKVQENIERQEKDTMSGSNIIQRERQQLEYLQTHRQDIIDTRNTMEEEKEMYKIMSQNQSKLQTDLINIFNDYVNAIKNDNGKLRDLKKKIFKTIQDIQAIAHNIQKNIAHQYIYNSTHPPWHEISKNIDLIESVIKNIDSTDENLLFIHQEDLVDIMIQIYNVIDQLPYSYLGLYIQIQNIGKSEEQEEEEEVEEEENETLTEEEKKDSEDKIVHPVKLESSAGTANKSPNNADIKSNITEKEKNVEESQPTDESSKMSTLEDPVSERGSESTSELDEKSSVAMTFSSKNIEMATKSITLKSKLKPKKKHEGSKKPKLIEVQDMKSSL